MLFSNSVRLVTQILNSVQFFSLFSEVRGRAYALFLCTSVISKTYESFAKVRTKKSGKTAIADLQNWTFATLCQIRIWQFLNYCSLHFWNWLRKCGYALANQHLFLKLWTAEKNCDCEMQLWSNISFKSCWSEVADWRKWDYGYAVVKHHFLKKLRLCSCGSPSFKLWDCDCGNKTSYACPPLTIVSQ